ncbi:MAG: hypothetical protein Q8O57_03935 [Kiritimatiellota bacterium]|nr:hypothetical protein [Kiritimatiellota bacterium]
MRKSYVTLACLVAFTLACGLLTPPATLTPVPHTNVVWIHLSEVSTTDYNPSIAAGATATLEAWFEPAVYVPVVNPDGSVSGRSMVPWESPNIAEMRFCFSASDPCQPEGDWLPYAAKQQFPILVDWLGPREFWLAAEFHDSSGNSIPSLDGSWRPQAVTQKSMQITGVWDEATPIGNQPAAVQTAVAATLAAYPVTGSVVLAGGNCCTGGTAGSTIDVGVEFAASSPYWQVTEMRVRTGGCFAEADMAEAAWEPFAASKTIPAYVVLNWVGFYVSVQYRDEQGHLSPVYCDDISVEGMPPPPTP